MRISLFTTGGTIDGTDSERGTAREISEAASWLLAQPGVTASVRSIFNKDSREITESDRELLLSQVLRCSDSRILITHGTFTIAQTGRFLKAALGSTYKTILLVGAWIPFGEPSSDAPNQMKFALSRLEAGVSGVHIAMDGRLWDPDMTEKHEITPGIYRLVEEQFK